MTVAERVRVDTASATFWAIACVPVIVVLTTPHVVVQDGGLHLSNAVALRGLIEGWFPSLLSWRPVLSPNMSVEVVLASLTAVFSPDTALRLVLVTGLVGFAIAVAALVRAAGMPAYMGIPLLVFEMHYFVMLGFLGFVWAVPLALGAVAVVLREPLNPPKAPLVLLLVATWFTHIVPALVATIATTVIVIVAHLANGGRPTNAVSAALKVLIAPVTTIAFLTAVWFVQTRTSELYTGHSIVDATKALVQFSSPLVSYANVEKWLARLLAVAVYAVGGLVIVKRVRDRRYLDRFDGLLVSAVAMGLMAVAVPEHANSGAGFIGVRLTLFAPLFLVLWVCTEVSSLETQRARAATAAMVAIAAVVAVAIPVVRIPALHRLSAQVEQIKELADCLPVHSTLIQLNLDLGSAGSARGLAPMAEQTGTISLAREALDLGNESGWYPYYVWRYTEVARADRFVKPGAHLDDVPPPINLNAAMSAALPLTAVVVYGRSTAQSSVRSAPEVRTLDEDLADQFRLVRTSSGGNAELWLRKDVTPSC